MNLRTFISVLGNGQLPLLLSLTRDVRRCYRVAFMGAGLSSGLLRRLAAGPVPLPILAAELGVDSSERDGLEAWLQLGTAIGELRSGPQGYSLRGKLSRKLLAPANDAAAAFIEEVAMLHTVFITQSPDRLRRARRFTLADHDARLAARSSRLAEPYICEALDAVIPRRGSVKLFEIGCGAAAYIRRAAVRNPGLTALGLELQPEVAALAAENVSKWKLSSRVLIETGDVMQRKPEPVFDVATLHQNLYYFPVASRVGVLRHVRCFLKPGGRLLLTTFCQGRGDGAAILNLWAAMTEGCGPLPTRAGLRAQLEEAGFHKVTCRNLIPGESFHAFVGVTRDAAEAG